MSVATLIDIKSFATKIDGVRLSNCWKIPSLKSDDIVWNIVFCYLNSFPLHNKKEWTKRIARLIGPQVVNESIEISLEICNPFHPYDCVEDEAFCSLVTAFKQRVEDYLKNDEIQLRSEPYVFRCLQASSKLLSCHIVVLSFPSSDEVLVNVFPVRISEPEKNYSSKIVLFYEFSPNSDLQDQFSFCLPKYFVELKRKQALEEILKQLKIDDKIIQKINQLDGINDNFLLSLLKNGFGTVINFVYETPLVLTKLAFAGFEIDPRKMDDTGKSAFFYALKTADSQIVFLLYKHIAKAWLQVDNSVKLIPNPITTENIKCLEKFMKLLEKHVMSGEMSKESKCLFEDLFLFNEVIIEMCKDLNDISLKINYLDQTAKEYESSQKKEIISTIIKTYETYINYVMRESKFPNNEDDISCFIQFFKHKDYFDKLDLILSLLFFNNIFLFKEALQLPDYLSINVEANYLYFICMKKYLERYEKKNCFASQWIASQEQLKFVEQMNFFKKMVLEEEVSDFNKFKFPGTIISTSVKKRDIYSYFLILRFLHYLDIAIGINVKDLKSILVIERCLQVLSECCQDGNLESVQRIIYLALPKDLARSLMYINFSLSHMNSRQLLFKKDLEQNFELFQKIQNDLANVKKLLFPIYLLLKYEMDQYLLSHFKYCVNIAPRRNDLREQKNCLKTNLKKPEDENEQILIGNHYLDNMSKCISQEITDLYCCKNLLDEYPIVKQIIQNVISSLEEKLTNLKGSISMHVENLESDFQCLDRILYCIINHQKMEKYRKQLILMKTNIRSLFAEVRKILEEHSSLEAGFMHIPIEMKSHSGTNIRKSDKVVVGLPKRLLHIVNDYKIFIDHIFQVFPEISNQDLNFSHIQNYALQIYIWMKYSENEKKIIFGQFSKEFMNNLPEVKTPFEVRQSLIYDAHFDVADDCYLEKRKEELCETKVLILEECGPSFEFSVNLFEFLQIRIKLLKNILIDENCVIQHLWKRDSTLQLKSIVKENIVQLYLNDSVMQASLETLLFDFMTVLDSKDLTKLWKQTTNLLNSMNLKNVLIPDEPVLHSFGRLLDPCDLISDLVDKLLQIIADENIIDSMQKILELTKSDLSGFLRVMDDKDGEFKNLREQILECDHWTVYASLIPSYEAKNMASDN